MRDAMPAAKSHAAWKSGMAAGVAAGGRADGIRWHGRGWMRKSVSEEVAVWHEGALGHRRPAAVWGFRPHTSAGGVWRRQCADGVRRYAGTAADGQRLSGGDGRLFLSGKSAGKVGQGDGFDCVAGGDEGAEVAGERGGIAGDVDQRGRGDGGEERGGLRAEAGAGRVDYDQVGSFGWAALRRRNSSVSVSTAGRRAIEIVRERGVGGGRGFYGDHALEVCG